MAKKSQRFGVVEKLVVVAAVHWPESTDGQRIGLWKR
jgi:hypothetical protein